MVTTTPDSPLRDSTQVMRARARNAGRFHMYMAATLRMDEADPHLRILMQGVDMGIAYYLLDSGDVLAFPMTLFNDRIEMHRPHLNPSTQPFIRRDTPPRPPLGWPFDKKV